MTFPELHVSRPGISFPKQRFDNAAIIDRVRAQFRGSQEQWSQIESALNRVFAMCKTEQRYLEFDSNARVADYAVEAAQNCLNINRASLKDVDLVIFGGIARQYFEPATAMEVATKLGLEETHAFDVTSACVGHLEAIHVACAYLNMHSHFRTALVCTSELFGEFVSYDIQSVKDLNQLAAGLTIGNAAACVLLRREPWADGGIQLQRFDTYTLPAHWNLCQAPIDGKFTSSSVELMRLSQYVTPRLRTSLENLGWSPQDIDHFVFHQPSELMVRKILDGVGADPARAVYTHHLYGNNASATVCVALHQLLEERTLRPGDKVILGSAAAGFSMIVAAGQWVS